MARFLEQTVVRPVSGKEKLLYLLSCCSLCVLMLFALVFAAGAIEITAAAGLRIHWFRAIAFLLCAAAAVLIWRGKDSLRLEYDYSLRGGTLEVCAVLNGRRRQRRIRLNAAEIGECGIVGSAAHERARNYAGLKRHNWYLNGDVLLHFVCYRQKQEHHMMILELNSEIAAQLRRELRNGVWQETEGKIF